MAPSKITKGRSAKTKEQEKQKAQAHEKRKSRFYLALGISISLLVLAAWFPLANLMRQKHQISNSLSELQIAQRHAKDLQNEQKQLEDTAVKAKIAQQQFGLSKTGEQVFQVVTKTKTSSSGYLTPVTTALTHGTTAYSTSTLTTTSPSVATSQTSKQSTKSLLDRIVHGLEFWN